MEPKSGQNGERNPKSKELTWISLSCLHNDRISREFLVEILSAWMPEQLCHPLPTTPIYQLSQSLFLVQEVRSNQSQCLLTMRSYLFLVINLLLPLPVLFLVSQTVTSNSLIINIWAKCELNHQWIKVLWQSIKVQELQMRLNLL